MKKVSLLVLLAIVAFNFVACDEDNDPQEEYQVYDNHIVLEGEDNMRDMGGFVGEDSKRVLYRKLFRSGELPDLTVNDFTTITELGINSVIDLRTDEEVEENPDVLPEGLASVHLSLLNNINPSGVDINYVIAGYASADDYMLPFYTVDAKKIEQWKIIFDMLEAQDQVTLWHCTAGKDRAGMTAALVLASLGVDRETIIEDYLASNTYLETFIEQTVAFINSNYGEGFGENLRPVLGVEREYIEAFFSDIDENHGGIDAFLDELGVDIQQMQANYLEN